MYGEQSRPTTAKGRKVCRGNGAEHTDDDLDDWTDRRERDWRLRGTNRTRKWDKRRQEEKDRRRRGEAATVMVTQRREGRRGVRAVEQAGS